MRLRIVRDLWDAPPPAPLLAEVLNQREALALARLQRRDGTWASWLHRAGISTENAVTRLAELGCPAEMGPLSLVLPRLIALLRDEPTPFVDLRRPGPSLLLRTRVRRVAAGLLCHAGLAEHKIVREAVEHEVDRSYRWALRARAEGIRVRAERTRAGRRELVHESPALDDEGVPLPDLHWLRAVAFSPGLRHDGRVQEVLRTVAQPDYQRLAEAGLGVLEIDGQRIRPGFGIQRADPEEASRAHRLGECLVVAELSARAGDSGPARRVIRFLDAHADPRGRVRISGGEIRCSGGFAIQGAWVRLGFPWRDRTRVIDLTFRKLLLERLAAD